VSWQRVGDVALNITERLNEPQILKITVRHISSEPQVIRVPVRVIEHEPLVLRVRVEKAS
jgi:hypothetical protein